MKWSIADVPDLHGAWFLLTGATGGLGHHLALEIARKGGNLILTARHLERAQDIAQDVRAAAPGVAVDIVALDLSELTSVRAGAARIRRDHRRVDVLINNAGVMTPPQHVTADGFELQMGTNHLGHFALTAALWPLLAASKARIVTVSSLAHTTVRGIDLRSLDPTGDPRRYRRWRSYGESKLANLVFSQELQRRIRARGVGATSVAAHPGIAYTKLTSSGPTLNGSTPFSVLMDASARVFAQSAYNGCLPILMAATTPNLAGGSYIGPSSMRQLRGAPQLVGMSSAARNEDLASRLWTASERAIGERFEVR